MRPHRTRTTSSSATAERRAARSTAFSSALTQRFDPGVEEPKTSSSSRHGTPAAAGMKKAERQPPKRQMSEVTGKATSTPRLLPSHTKALAREYSLGRTHWPKRPETSGKSGP